MLKPREINPSAPDPLAEVTHLEHQFDTAIQAAAASGKWPAIVGNARDGVSTNAIASVVQSYRDQGWIVTSAPGSRAVIDHPDRLVEPPAGFEDRAVERAKREGVLR